MNKHSQDQADTPPWEDAGEEPQKVSAAEASAAAAVINPNGPTAGKAAGRSRWRPPSLLGHKWIMKNIRFFLFLATLAVIYIYNGHYADKVVRDINHTSKELKELQYEYKTLRSEVMFRSKQSELARAVEPFGLKELTLPPFVIVDSIQNYKN